MVQTECVIDVALSSDVEGNQVQQPSRLQGQTSVVEGAPEPWQEGTSRFEESINGESSSSAVTWHYHKYKACP